MRYLLTNDDGIDAPGLAALADGAGRAGEALVVAPLSASSGCGHQVTTRTPLKLHGRGAQRWAVAGWPADCVRVALRGLMLEADWVLSGINAGGNLGADVFVSGTVAAVREAVFLGKPGIAFSHYKKRELEFDWDRAAGWVASLLPELTARTPDAGAFWNVNFPHPGPGGPEPRIVYCPLDTSPMPVSFRLEGDEYHYAGDYHARPRLSRSDVDVCLGGDIAVSLLRLS